MYKLVFDERALRELHKLESNVKDRIWNKLQSCKENPFRFFDKLVEIGSFKLRVGDWRVVADIYRADEIINILKIGHRKNIYDK